jgi:hypothetical protein
MRLGIVIAIVAGLLAVLALAVPVPYGPEPLPATEPRSGFLVSMCVALHYGYDKPTAELPSHVRLRTDTMFPGSDWLKADGLPNDGPFADSWWRISRDSQDLVWHHSPVVRLPLFGRERGDTAIGRIHSAGTAPIALQLLLRSRREYPVIVTLQDCSTSPFAPPT